MVRTFLFPTAQFANKNNEEKNEGNKPQIQTPRENTFCFSQRFWGQENNSCTSAAVGFIRPLGCCTKIATELETSLSRPRSPAVLALGETLCCPPGCALWDKTETASRKTDDKAGESCTFRSLLEVFTSAWRAEKREDMLVFCLTVPSGRWHWWKHFRTPVLKVRNAIPVWDRQCSHSTHQPQTSYAAFAALRKGSVSHLLSPLIFRLFWEFIPSSIPVDRTGSAFNWKGWAAWVLSSSSK